MHGALSNNFNQSVQLVLLMIIHGVLELLSPLPLGFISQLGYPPYCSSIRTPQEQNFQVADKCIDTTLTINIL